MQFVDTHCHIHSRDYPIDREEAYQRAIDEGVTKLICVGTDEHDSKLAVEFAKNHQNTWASIGLHPHDAVHGAAGIKKLRALLAPKPRVLPSGPPLKFFSDEKQFRELPRRTSPAESVQAQKVVAIGECGLDYFYNHSPREQQITMFRAQIELAIEHDLPLIFHVRDAFDDFWPIFDAYQGLRGVLHSFTDSQDNLQKALERGLFIGVNGISTFTKADAQKDMFASIPLQKLLLETDAPFLTPVPKRGKVNEPANARLIAKHMADLRSITLKELSVATSQNANTLFF